MLHCNVEIEPQLLQLLHTMFAYHDSGRMIVQWTEQVA